MKKVTAVCLFLFAYGLPYAADAPGFKVTNRWPVSGDGGFDYIVFDGSANRLYVSHGTKVDVLDAGSGKVIGMVANTPGVHGIAIVPALRRGFTTNGGDSSISVFDTNTLKTLKKIQVNEDPDFVFYDAKADLVMVCHGDGAMITLIDPKKEEVAGKIALGGGAEAAVVDDKGNGFVNLEEQAADTYASVGDIQTEKSAKTMAFDPSSKRLFLSAADMEPAPGGSKDRMRPKPGSFKVLVVERQ